MEQLFPSKTFYICIFLQNSFRLHSHAHKSKRFTLKVPPGTRLGDIKEAIEKESTWNAITVFQEIGANEYLVELTSSNQAQESTENGFDTGNNHFRCHLPHGFYLNVSIPGLKAPKIRLN